MKPEGHPPQDDGPSETTEVGAPAPLADAAEHRIDKLGHYELVDELGRGGMGIVYRARDTKLERDVAVKLVRAGRVGSATEVERFRLEARAMARLRHPNVVTVHEVGESRYGPYFVMDLVTGETLAAKIVNAWPLEQRRVARWASKVARALAAAHAQGFLHRDVKPSNVLIAANDEPLLVDFGLARDLKTTERLTEKSLVVGTPCYMSPEQARGRAELVDRRSDVYQLGATLYESLTGAPPFDGETNYAVLQSVVDDDPVPPSRRRPDIEHDLETICRKCLEKDPADRYGSAGELADDLERFLRDEAIVAVAPGLVERARKWRRRNRTLAGVIGAALAVLLVAGGVGTATFVRQLRAERDAATLARERAARALDLLVSQVRDELADVGAPRVREMRRRLLEHALVSLDELAGDTPLGPRAAEAHRQIAELALEVGDTARALREAEVAVEILRRDGTDAPALVATLVVLGEVRRVRGDLGGALVALDEAFVLSRSGGDPSGALLVAARVHEACGRLAAARAALEEALLLRRAKAGTDALAPLLALANVCRLQGELVAARERSGEALAATAALVSATPGSVKARRRHSEALLGAGDVAIERGELDEGEARIERALAVEGELVAADPHDRAASSEVAATLRRLGDARLRRGDPEAALARYGEALAIARALHAKDAADVEARLGLAETLERIGEARQDVGDLDAARAALDEALALARSSSDMLSARATARFLARAARLRELAGDVRGAREAYEDAARLGRHVVAQDASQAATRRELLVTLGRTGEFLEDQDDLAGAQRFYEEAHAIAEDLYARDPTNARVRANRAAGFMRLGLLLDRRGRSDEAVRQFEEAIADYDALAKKSSHYAETRAWLGRARDEFATTHALFSGARQPASAEEELVVARAHYRSGQHAEAVARFEKAWGPGGPEDGTKGDVFGAACAAALASAGAKGAEAERLRGLALAWLEVAVRRLRTTLGENAKELAAARGKERGRLVERRAAILSELERARTRAPELAAIRGTAAFEALFLEK